MPDCEICDDTGTITLLRTVEPCECQHKNQINWRIRDVNNATVDEFDIGDSRPYKTRWNGVVWELEELEDGWKWNLDKGSKHWDSAVRDTPIDALEQVEKFFYIEAPLL